MRIAIIGVGSIGSRHAEYLREAGHATVTVDCNGQSDFLDLSDIPQTQTSGIDAWVVSTPTHTHLQVLRRILHTDPRARVLLEKPAVIPAEVPALTQAVHDHPAARVLVNNVYAHSAVVLRFVETVRQLSATDPIRRITIEFTKNRQADVAAGRFVDTHYGEVGYEWFHMLAILREILDPPAFRSFLRTTPSHTHDVRVRTTVGVLPCIELYASTDGLIGFPGLAGHAFRSLSARRHIARARIPYGSDLRYRFAYVELASGAHVCLVFESYYAVADGYKNIHAVRIATPAGAEQVTDVFGNQLKSALLAQLRTLTGASGGMTRVYLPEHAYMAALAKRLAASGRQPEFCVRSPGDMSEMTA